MLKKFLTVLAFTLFFSAPAWADQNVKRYAVLPFEVHGPQEYAYLSKGIQSMLSSRLTHTGQTSPVPTGEVNQEIQEPPRSSAEAGEMLGRLNADFVVYGTASIVDDQCNLDIYAVGDEFGEQHALTRQTTLGQLIPALEDIARELTSVVVAEVREETDLEPEEIAEPVAEPPDESDIYISQHFHFHDDPQAAGRWRSQTLPYAGRGIAAGDAQGNGEQNIFILDERRVYAYTMHENRLKHLSTYEAPGTYENLRINMLDINRNGREEIIVSAIQQDRPRSYILGFENDDFQELHTRIPFFMNVVSPPPEYRPVLVGQRLTTGTRLFRPGTVQEIMYTSDGPELGTTLSLPDRANLFNFAYLPRNDGYLVVVAHNDRLEVYSDTHNRRYTTSDEYAGSGLGIETDDTLPGMGQPSPGERDVSYYYIPTRLLSFRMQGQEEHHLLAHKHFAGRMASVFQRYRNFPEGEIHALFWDDVGLNLHWSTRRIKASIVDFGLYDVDGDGQRELVVCVNTHPGITGMQEKRTIVLAYKMEM